MTTSNNEFEVFRGARPTAECKYSGKPEDVDEVAFGRSKPKTRSKSKKEEERKE